MVKKVTRVRRNFDDGGSRKGSKPKKKTTGVKKGVTDAEGNRWQRHDLAKIEYIKAKKTKEAMCGQCRGCERAVKEYMQNTDAHVSDFGPNDTFTRAWKKSSERFGESHMKKTAECKKCPGCEDAMKEFVRAKRILQLSILDVGPNKKGRVV